MNRPGSIDGILEAWLLDGPSEMPDRVYDAVFDRVDHVPQRRLARLQLRFTDMSPTVRWLAAGAAAVILAGVGFTAVNRFSETGPGAPTPPPDASPSESASPAAGAPLPASLRHPFLGPSRDVPPLGVGDRRVIDLTDGSFYYANGDTQWLHSTAQVEGSELVLTMTEPTGGCATGNEGRYPWSLSPGESFLTIDAGTDPCASRLGVMPGTWQRSNCLNPDNNCLGVLEAGTYSSLYVRPDLAPNGTWTADFGAFRYIVPVGWANSADGPDHYAFMRAGPYEAGETGGGAVTPDSFTLLVRPGAARLHSGCSEEAEPGIGNTRADLAAWLRGHPGLVVTEQPDVTIDGNPATVLDLGVADAWTETCNEAAPFVAAPVFFSGYHWALAKNDRMRVILVDLPSGTTAAIVIDVESPSTFEALIDETMPIVESFDFK